MIRNVAVFCASSNGVDPAYRDAAVELGRTLAQQDIGLIYGGANVGLMRAVAESALLHGGRVVGVIPEVLVDLEIAHRGLTELHITTSMHTRKAMMGELADAFLVLPGGFGTLDELAEVLTLIQTKKSRHVPIILVGGEFWRGLLAWFKDSLVPMGLINPDDMNLMQVIDEPEQVLEAVLAFYEDRDEGEHPPAKSEEDRMFYL